MKTQMLLIQAVSGLHVGTGQGVGLVDLPIAREKITNFPVVPGSGLKGSLRAHFQRQGNGLPVTAIFGPESDNPDHASCLTIGDARLLALPVRSLGGTFCWATTPLILERLRRDAQLISATSLPEVPSPAEGEALVDGDSKLPFPTGTAGKRVVLEEYDLKPVTGNALFGKWVDLLTSWLWNGPELAAWKPLFAKRFAILHEKLFNHLVEFGTEVAARIRIDPESGTVDEHALWYEEALPAESLLVSVVGIEGAKVKPKGEEGKWDAAQIADALFGKGPFALHLGGKHTTGKGLCRVIPVGPSGK